MVWLLSLLTLGINFTFWAFVGILRFVVEKISEPRRLKKNRFLPLPITFNEVAAIIPAHNEEKSIIRTINALLEAIPRKNIYIVSDNSTDRTVDIARSMGIRSLDVRPNKGKARALVHIMNEYEMLKAYKAILINDADSIIEPKYILEALKCFRDENVAAVSPHGRTMWRNYSLKELYLIGYRAKLWMIMQWGIRYGMTWKLTNVNYIIPGAFSIYRTRVLEKLEIDAPGLVIEDFNMTFEVQRKKLGKIVYFPRVKAVFQDPYNFRDYIKQVRRWNVGFWQTVKRHGIWPSMFWLALGAFLIELTFYTIFLLSVPFIIILFAFNSFDPISIPYLYRRLTVIDILVGIFLIDYLTTAIAAFHERKLSMLFVGLGFIFIRYLDAVLYVISIPEAFFKRSSGTWESPERS
jgi:poly-beta-1,6-N-acetyl-D-glucosamine synthase